MMFLMLAGLCFSKTFILLDQIIQLSLITSAFYKMIGLLFVTEVDLMSVRCCQCLTSSCFHLIHQNSKCCSFSTTMVSVSLNEFMKIVINPVC